MTKKAFLCGVNLYRVPGADLRGCVNDVMNMQNVLTDLYEFPSDNITVVTDYDATKARMESGLQDLIGGAVAGDVLYFHFSGHGSNVPDQDGDEADGRDEIFCPTDLNWRDPLRDDWVRVVLDTLPEGVNLTMITDCCHSGSITRAIVPPDAERISRYLPCPRDIFAAESGGELTGTVNSVRKTRGLTRGLNAGAEVKDVELTEVLLTGCQDKQTSADAHIGGTYQGAMTNSLVSALRAANGKISYRDLHANILSLLADGDFEQTPQLEGQAMHFDQEFLTPFA